ncbi:hypothetical protein AGABI1DRAFT_124718 [Agaricus bisporus var. burnettii JB137-S8]|uniref:Uncharacterized protein n=1 Tax=Agaricus bisporus var. burnettii (strain JB137-S8 / ATCC MYA-4627 / FGSC 10392) TaxID=597362 RepID=K5Y7Z9_AGABU|nr:uncharacterized protein AGABI1DRAFT_124718 [Agaricus bisporus var. burnettii JB137-S8]EKM84410.1 hypothetical protein AGABI1DRAFT_124718 [Agaricus bisporus var. burnettii JB137-S8]
MSEDDIRQLVHQLAFNYAKAHLTIDHDEYTRDLYNLLKPFFLKQVPLADPKAFTILVDPLDAFFKTHNIRQHTHYDEGFRTTIEATQLLNQHAQMRSEPLKTEKIMADDMCGFPDLREPFMAILTRRSVCTGLFRAQSTRHCSVPNTMGALLLRGGIESVRDEAVQEPEISSEQMLKTVWEVDHEYIGEIRTLFRDVTSMRSSRLDYRNSALHAFLHEDELLPTPPLPEFTPIFPRSRDFGHGKPQIGPEMLEQRGKGLVENFPQVQMGSDDSYAGILQGNLEIVGGWHALRVSSPISVATPTTSQEDDRIDQLFLEDSPATDPMIGLMNEGMGMLSFDASFSLKNANLHFTLLVKRKYRFHVLVVLKGHMEKGRICRTFLPAMLDIKTASLNPLNDIEAERRPPSPQSMLGQASMETDAIEGDYNLSDWNSFNMDIQSLGPTHDLTDIIMQVKADEKNDMLMEVPQLASPNTLCPASFTLPAKLADLTQDGDELYGRRRLKKNCKGLPALRLSLSWVTFTVDSPLSHQEASGVCGFGLDSAVKKDVDEQLKMSCFERVPVTESRFAFLDEGPLELLETLQQESRPFIAVPRRSRQSFPPHPRPQRASPSAGCLNAGVGQPTSVGTELWDSGQPLAEPQVEFPNFAYEPSILQFEDIIDSRIFNEPPTSELRKLSTIEVALVPATNDFDISETNTAPFDHDHTLVDAGFMDSAAPFMLTGEEFSGTDLDSHISRLAEFTRLRAKDYVATNTATIPADLPPSSDPTNHSSSISDEIAATIMDTSTIFLPESMAVANHSHRYMASLDFVQRQAIVRLLRSREWNVDLAERVSLGGVDLIVDPHSAIIVTSLFTLPSRGQQLVHRISEHSWRFKHLLVLLEAYPESIALRPAKSTTATISDGPVISAYTPPILKAIRKLRRDVIIGEACGKKRVGCKVEYGFVNDAKEAARFVRYFGEMAEMRDESGGVLWQPRGWLDVETSQDEEDLAKLKGMNQMSATILLCKATTEDILNMLPEQRIEEFGFLIGLDAVNLLNEDLNERFQMMEISEDGTSSFVN